MTSSKSKTQNSKLSSVSAAAPPTLALALRARASATQNSLVREHAEQQFAQELEELAKVDTRQGLPNWKLSPWAVTTYLLSGKLDNGFVVSPKYIGNRRIIESAVATLTTDRALLLIGVPCRPKSWVSEHLADAIAGNSTLLIQGTAGTSEEAIRYGWNYARLLADGLSMEALVPSPLMRAMRESNDGWKDLYRACREVG